MRMGLTLVAGEGRWEGLHGIKDLPPEDQSEVSLGSQDGYEKMCGDWKYSLEQQ